MHTLKKEHIFIYIIWERGREKELFFKFKCRFQTTFFTVAFYITTKRDSFLIVRTRFIRRNFLYAIVGTTELSTNKFLNRESINKEYLQTP